MRVRPCPVCNTKKQSPKMMIGNFGIVKCSNCKFVYVCNPPRSEAYPDSENITLIRQSVLNPHFRHIAIKNFLNTKFDGKREVSVLEVGAGAGTLGLLLQKQESPIKYQYTGYEPSVPRAAVAAENKLNVVQGFLEQPVNEKVDAIVMDNVLEHISKPHELISIISKSLKTDGVIVIIVPNFSDVRKFLPYWKKRFFWRPRKHISYFTFRSLSKLLEQHGLILHPMPSVTQMPFGYRVSTTLSRFRMFPLGLYTYATILRKS